MLRARPRSPANANKNGSFIFIRGSFLFLYLCFSFRALKKISAVAKSITSEKSGSNIVGRNRQITLEKQRAILCVYTEKKKENLFRIIQIEITAGRSKEVFLRIKHERNCKRNFRRDIFAPHGIEVFV